MVVTETSFLLACVHERAIILHEEGKEDGQVEAFACISKIFLFPLTLPLGWSLWRLSSAVY